VINDDAPPFTRPATPIPDRRKSMTEFETVDGKTSMDGRIARFKDLQLIRT
jgi:hypothetical protein